MADTPLRPDIEAAKAQMPATLGTGRALRSLAGQVWERETVERIVIGSHCKGLGLLVLTDHRVMFVRDAEPAEEFPLDRITSVQWADGRLLGTVTIHASGGETVIKGLERYTGRAFADAVTERIDSRRLEVVAPPPAPGDVFEQLRKLAELRDAGILTEAEFTAKKTELLQRL
ncbi:SHOCT domain-containing protein [Dactylosporangium sp. NBC_01737]|uniref:SHOCT domain-containing protein n=1 Tax=Dactylosporangium sp. NBC_01737 TaxID=2975959 RepID=UPI002E0F8328|nr:SHOCT domain-containing protein [Dactylosporangium sp. NBC_01737]